MGRLSGTYRLYRLYAPTATTGRYKLERETISRHKLFLK